MQEIVIKQSQGSIDANFEEVKSYLADELKIYKGMLFTEDSKKQAKETVAELRKGKKELADRCKAVKTEYMKPLNDFMGKAEELGRMFDEPINFINEQVNDFERKRIEEKKKEVANIYTELVEEEWSDIIPLNRIYNPKWENATFSVKQIREEIMDFKLKVKDGLEIIKSFHSEMESGAINMYKHDFDLTKATLYLTDYEKQKREILERERAKAREEEEARIRAEERKKIEEEERARVREEEEIRRHVELAKAETIEAFIPADDGAEEKTYFYTLLLTPDAKEKVEAFLNSIGVEFFGREETL